MKKSSCILFLAIVLCFSYIQAEEVSDGSSDDVIQELTSENILETEEFISDANVVSSSQVGSIYCPRKFVNYSFAGMSGTDIDIYDDWSFSIITHDGEMVAGPGYTSTIFFAQLIGQLGEPTKLDGYSYRIPVLSTAPKYEEGYERIENNTRHLALNTDGLLDTDQLILYIPGTPVSMLPDQDSYWVSRCVDTTTGIIMDGSYVLYNPGSGISVFAGVASSEEDGIPLTSLIPEPSPTPTPAPVSDRTGNEQITDLKGASASEGSVLTWSAYPKAEGYLIGAIQNGNAYKQIDFVVGGNNTRYVDKNASYTTYSYYWVFPYKKVNGKVIRGAASSTYVYGIKQLPAPKNLKATGKTGGVDLGWDSVSDADGFIIKRRTGSSGSAVVIADVTGTSYTDTTASTTDNSFYWVYAYKKSGNTKRPGAISSYAYAKAK